MVRVETENLRATANERKEFPSEVDSDPARVLPCRSDMKSERATSTVKYRVAKSGGQELRAVGQGLESLDVEDFDLTVDVEGYFALATRRVPTRTRKAAVRKVVRIAWHKFSGHNTEIDAGPDVLRVVFTPDGIFRLERMGRQRRKPQLGGLPDLTRLAQILRIVGERLDELSGRLVKVSKRGEKIIIEYSSAANRRRTEEWKLSELAELWLNFCQRRRERSDAIERELDRAAK